MKKIIIPAIIFLHIVSFAIIFLVFPRGDERQIRKDLSSLATMVSKSGSENEFIILANVRKVKSFFAQDCQIAVGVPIPEIIGHEMLASTIYQALKTVNRIDIDFCDISVTIEENQTIAKTTMTAMARGPDPQGDERVTEAREIEMQWEKVDGAWKIAKVQEVKTLR